MMNKTLGLLLLPLVPLSAIGIVSLVNRALPSTPPPASEPVLVDCQHMREAPRPTPHHEVDLNPMPA